MIKGFIDGPLITHEEMLFDFSALHSVDEHTG
jgi:hypothetical protein